MATDEEPNARTDRMIAETLRNRQTRTGLPRAGAEDLSVDLRPLRARSRARTCGN